MDNLESQEYPAFGKIYVIPEISTEQYEFASAILEKNDLGAMTNESSTRLLSIALVEKGTEVWTPEIGKANEELFKRFPMKARVICLKNFFGGVKDIADTMKSAFDSFAPKKTE